MVDKKYHMYYGCFVNMFFSQGKKKPMYLKFIESEKKDVFFNSCIVSIQKLTSLTFK